MSITYDRLHMAYFPAEYADILIETLAITPAKVLGIKDALYHFRELNDDQAAEVIEAIADQIETDETQEACAMKRSHVNVAVRILEIYEVEAADEAEARDCWSDGKLIHTSDEALDSEVLSVEVL
ncbi:MAG: hypothetical protein ACLQVF_28270 [Isosphaeraceae bacterium]